VISNLIGYLYSNGDRAERRHGQHQFRVGGPAALQKLHGTFGLAILCADYPDALIGAKRGSPLILGVGHGEYILASDAAAIVEHTTQAIYLADNEMVTVGSDGFYTKTIDNVVVAKDLMQIEFSLDQIELDGFEHHMLKEIFEQPQSAGHLLGRTAQPAVRQDRAGGHRPTTCGT